MSAPDFSDVSKYSDTRALPTPSRVANAVIAPLPVPAFSDIAKPANDLINRDFYHATAAALEVKLKAANGLATTIKGTAPHEGNTSASVETKQSPSKGVTVTGAWNTASVLTAKAELADVLAKGLKGEALSLINPSKGGLVGVKGNLAFKQPNYHGRVFADYGANGSLLATLDGVVGQNGILVGGEAGYDVQKATITRYSLALGYQATTFSAALTATNNLNILSALYYQKVNSTTEVGVKAAFDAKVSAPAGIELASKYKIDPATFVKAKINDRGIAALAYNTKVNSGFTLGLGVSFDTQKINEPGHKVGASFTFEG